ncbi:transcriptional regulator [Mangrovimonas yunxiaonensis]|uniref:Transcriptional regulator n=1 Tax=Mangrovimonas yunxiaonensis TaxID=1197477 RepID=A0A084TJC6_9FLAO|nr:YqgE/AlgH family protein [Mangrovimonas yunxiaonensis]KFB00812.1 transcriptional regulator [Mangrovimonas yunxiaonensis]
MITLQPKRGNLLIAKPSIIGDISFNRSIVLLADHSEEGSIGFILNKPLDFTLGDIIPSVPADFHIYNGGPVEQDNLYFIHKVPELIPNSIEISLGIYWGGDFNQVAELILNKKLTSRDIKFFLGYSGWSTNQLNEELKLNSWVIAENIYKKAIIEKDYHSFWKEKMLELGGEYSIWSNAPENPSFN